MFDNVAAILSALNHPFILFCIGVVLAMSVVVARHDAQNRRR